MVLQRPMIMDSDVSISLLKSGVFKVLGCMNDYDFIITEINYDEISKGPERSELDGSISKKQVRVIELSDPSALAVFSKLLEKIDPGEASVIALAKMIDGDVIMHDRAGRRAAKSLLSVSQVHRLEDIMVEAVRVGCLTYVAADDATKRLMAANDYLPIYSETGISQIIDSPTFGISRNNIGKR